MHSKYSSLTAFVLAMAFLVMPACAWADDWVIAAEKFSYQKKSSVNSMEDGIASLLPQLMLEQISTGARRIPSATEISARKKVSLKNERTSLFLQLSKAVQTRDSLVVSINDQKKLKKAIAQEEEKIKALEEKLAKNLEDQKSIDFEFEKTDGEGQNKSSKEQGEIVPSERVALYKNSYSTLFSMPESSGEKFPVAIEKALVKEKINGLISGKITSYGGYIMVNVELHAYPGGELIGSATDVGSMRDAQGLAQNLVQALMPQIANALPMEIFFYITPREAKSKYRITLDDVKYANQPEKITVESGIHTLTFECEGYSSQTVTWNFNDQQAFLVNVNFQEKVEGTYTLNLNANAEGNLYANGQLIDSITKGKVGTEVVINGQPVIGQFIVPGPEVKVEKKVTDEEGNETVTWETVPGESITSFFYIPADLQNVGAQLLVRDAPVDMNKLINERRIWAYRGYSSFVISMPVFLISLGKYKSASNAYASGKISSGEVAVWNGIRWVSAGTTIAAGGFFLFELVRYLRTAAKVIPSSVDEIDVTQIPVWIVEEEVPTETEDNQETLETQETQDVLKTETN